MSMVEPPGHRPSVVIWRSEWLQASETFIRHHADHVGSWQVITLGAVSVPSTLVRDGDETLFGRGRLERLRYDLFRATGLSVRLWHRLRQARPTIVHVHFATDAIRVAPVCMFLGIPFVVTVHGKDVTSRPAASGLRGRYYRWAARRTLGQAAGVVAVSQYIADRAIALGADPAKVNVHHTGVPIGEPSTRPVEARYDAVLVGRLVEKKGALDFVEALGLLAGRSRAIRAAIVGSGPMDAEIRAAVARAGVEVDMLGSLTPAQVAEVMDASAMVVAPSRTAADGDSEGLPTVVMEAGVRSRAVVAYRHSGIPEAIVDGETGLLCPEGDVTGLAEAIALLLDDPGRCRDMGMAGRARMVEHFDITKQTGLLEAYYDEIAGKHGASSW